MSEPDNHYRSSRMAEAHSRLSVRTPRYESSKIHSVDSYVQNTIDTLPQTMDRIAQLRLVSYQVICQGPVFRKVVYLTQWF